MIVRPVKTDRISPGQISIFKVLDTYLSSLKEGSIVAVTSKLVSICENRIISFDDATLEELTKSEADYYLADIKYPHKFTIKNSTLVVRAGIDKNIKKRYYILWPESPQQTTNEIRSYLRKKWNLNDVGVVITDSVSTPLRRGVTGIAIAYSGFHPLKDYSQTSRANIAGALATCATLVMGEGKETTPIAVIEQLPLAKFQENNPSEAELRDYFLTIEEDIFAPFLKAVSWQKNDY